MYFQYHKTKHDPYLTYEYEFNVKKYLSEDESYSSNPTITVILLSENVDRNFCLREYAKHILQESSDSEPDSDWVWSYTGVIIDNLFFL